jgi:hypothetical protein
VHDVERPIRVKAVIVVQGYRDLKLRTRSGKIKSLSHSTTAAFMGSMVRLLPDASILIGQELRLTDHGVLFQSGDGTVGPYKYVGESNERIIEEKSCLCGSLSRIIRALKCSVIHSKPAELDPAIGVTLPVASQSEKTKRVG